MSLARLTEILPPPPLPKETGDVGAWTDIEKDVGSTLPDDFKEFIQTYGTGLINRFICIWNPFAENEYVNFTLKSQLTLKALRRLKAELKRNLNIEVPPYPLFPELGGLLPIGATRNGDVLFWKTEGSPTEWTIIVQRVRSPDYEEHLFGMNDFLVELILKRIPKTFFYETPFRRGGGFEQILP